MATTTYAGSASGIVYGGGVPDGSQLNTPNNFGGEFIQQRVGSNAEIRVNFTGTQCELRIYADGNPWTWTIDGGSNQTASPSGNNMQWLTVATALSDTTHTLVVKPVGTFAGWDSLLRVTGASPAISAPTGYTNPQFGFTSSGVTRDNSAYRTSAVEGYLGVTDHGSCRFKATTSSIKIWNRYDLNYPIGLVIDDDVTTLVRQNPSYGWGWTEFSGLDGSAEHSYRFIIPNGVYFYNFMAAGLNTTSLTPYPADYWMGDSITANSTITNGDAAPGYFIQYAVKAHRGWQVQAQGGATAATQGVSWKTYPGLASPTPDRVIIAFGTNDLGNAESSGTWTSAITSIITQINSDLPTKKVIWLGLFDTSFNHTNRGTYNTDLSNTIAAYGNSLVTYFSTDGTGTIATSDSVHPDATGSATLGNYLFSNLDPPTGYTLTVAQGSISLSGQSVNLLATRTLPVAQGSVTLTAEPANLLASRVQVVDQGTVSLSAQSVNLLAGRSLPVAQDSVALTGQSVNLLAARTLPVAQGSVTLSGQAVNLLAARTLPVAQGSVALSAQDVNLIYSGGGAKVLTVDQGTISLSGQSVNLLAARTLPVAQGSVTLTAEPVNLLFGRTLAVDQGSITLTAEPVSLLAARTLAVTQGNVALTAQNVTLIYSAGGAVLVVDQDTISLSGQTVNLLANRTLTVDQAYLSLTAAGQGTTQITATVVTASILGRYTNNGGPGDTFTGLLGGTITDNGHTFVVGDSVLVNRSVNLANGLYVCTVDGSDGSAAVFVRDSRMVSAAAIANTVVTASALDTTKGGNSYINGVNGPITFGTTPLTFVQTWPVNLLASRKTLVDQGTITLTPYNVNLTYSGAPVSRAVIAIRCLNGNRWVRAARTPGG